jgi:tRNA-splicing ligase RtcB (3'-phosphate/5'-hydroxy nucleic acid ligase)
VEAGDQAMIAMKMMQKVNEYEWVIPTAYRQDMRVPVRIFADREILEATLGDLSMEQAINAATLPGLVGEVVVMPDVHQGYGFPIGGVAASRIPDGIISPGAIGYDINCGVRLLASAINFGEVRGDMRDLVASLNANCPSGVGIKGARPLSSAELDVVCREGARWALKQGYGSAQDLRRTEENGCLENADPDRFSPRARERGRPQLGTLGAGNHFIEVDVVDQIFDQESARVMGLVQDCLALQIHCGSRGFGHQICSDYVRDFQVVVKRYGIKLPDRELVCAPLDSPEGKAYVQAMHCAANYAFANRQLLAHQARLAFESVLAGKVKNWWLYQVYDIAHNMGKMEMHKVEGRVQSVCVHRKGATRSFGPGSKEIPEEYRQIGQPVLVPGSMGTASWVLAGTEKSMMRTFGSCCHGAGRVMSRSKAKHEIRGDRLREELEDQGIMIHAGSLPGLAEEAPQAYKDVDHIVKIVTGSGIARKVARLRPVAVVKG